MKLMAIIVLVCAYILGAYDGDSTAAVVLTMLFMPVIFERKSHRKKGAGAEVLRKQFGKLFLTKDCKNRDVFADGGKTRKSFNNDGAVYLFLGGIEQRELRQ